MFASYTALSSQAGRREFAEHVRRGHYVVATAESPHVAGGEMYAASQKLFLEAIALAYPDVKARDVYDVWCDCMESVAWCVRVVREDMFRYPLFDGQTLPLPDGWRLKLGRRPLRVKPWVTSWITSTHDA